MQRPILEHFRHGAFGGLIFIEVYRAGRGRVHERLSHAARWVCLRKELELHPNSVMEAVPKREIAPPHLRNALHAAIEARQITFFKFPTLKCPHQLVDSGGRHENFIWIECLDVLCHDSSDHFRFQDLLAISFCSV